MIDLLADEERYSDTTLTRGNSTVTLLANTYGLRTFALEYPRYIHSELMTHRVFSRNARSSRAVPVGRLIYEAECDYVTPSVVYQNCRGMTGKEKLDPNKWRLFIMAWHEARVSAVEAAKKMDALGVHKQHINRILEPYTRIKTIVTGDDFDNFYKLRLAPDAEPEMQNLAKLMREAEDIDTYRGRYSNGVHLIEGPEVDRDDFFVSAPFVTAEEFSKLDLIDILKVSGARCARVSYSNHDGTTPDIQRDLKLADELLKNGHMSPFEHPCIHYPEKKTSHYNLSDWASFRYLYETKRLAVLKP